MSEVECPGLPASWFNAWLAAVGTTVLVPELRLSWTTDADSRAVLCAAGDSDIAGLLAAAWPTSERIADLPIAENWRGGRTIAPNVPLPAFRERAAVSRGHNDTWALTSTYTDLHVEEAGDGDEIVARSRLAPAAPGPVGPIHRRLARVLGRVDEPLVQLKATLEGRARRVSANGLGFDIARITATGDDSDKVVDPVLEVLSFFGMALLPIRGAGTRRRANERAWVQRARQRLWFRDPDDSRRMRLMWPAWRDPLTVQGIDALLDVWDPARTAEWHRFGVHAAWRAVEFFGQGKDTTYGIGSEAL